MAITIPTLAGPESIPIERINSFAVNYFIEDGDPAVELVAAPSRAGSAIYITNMIISVAVDDQVGLMVRLQDRGINVLFGWIQLQRDGAGGGGQAHFSKHWCNPLKVADNTALDVRATTSIKFTIYIEGFVGDLPLG